jgi:hypothetical protein
MKPSLFTPANWQRAYHAVTPASQVPRNALQPEPWGREDSSVNHARRTDRHAAVDGSVEAPVFGLVWRCSASYAARREARL